MRFKIISRRQTDKTIEENYENEQKTNNIIQYKT